MNETAERLNELVKSVKGYGAVKEVEELFSISFYDLKRSVRGPSYELTLKILDFLEVPVPEFAGFAGVNPVREEEPDWWEGFEETRLLNPDETLKRISLLRESGWKLLAVGMIAAQWGQREVAISFLKQGSDVYRVHRNLALVYSETSRSTALYHSERAAAIAVFSGRSLQPLVVERAGILSVCGDFLAAISQLSKVDLPNLNIHERGMYWQQKTLLYLALEQDKRAAHALIRAEELIPDIPSRSYEGHVRWMSARMHRSEQAYLTAIEAFGSYFPREAALVALELHALNSSAGGLGFAAEIFCKNGFTFLSALLEDQLALSQMSETPLSPAPKIERWWRARACRALRQAVAS